MVKLLSGLSVDLLYSPGDDSSLLEVIRESKHGVSFSTSGLSVAHHSAIVAADDWLDDLVGRGIVDIVLRGIMKDSREFELPVVESIVDHAVIRLSYLDLEVL